MCEHQPPCPSADARDREAARAVHRHPEQGWSLLCNGMVLFDDGGELLPGGRVVPPRAFSIVPPRALSAVGAA
jgi:hypothetical protein